MLQIGCGIFPAPLPPLDQTHQLEYPRIVWQGLTSNFQFGQRAVIIEVPAIKILCPRKVRFARVGTETKRCLNGRLRQRQTRRRSIVAKEVKNVMGPSQLTICLEKRRICETAWFNRSIASSKSFFPALLKNAGEERLLARA